MSNFITSDNFLTNLIFMKVHIDVEVNCTDIPVNTNGIHKDFPVCLDLVFHTMNKRIKLESSEKECLDGDKEPLKFPQLFKERTPLINLMCLFIKTPWDSARTNCQKQNLLQPCHCSFIEEVGSIFYIFCAFFLGYVVGRLGLHICHVFQIFNVIQTICCGVVMKCRISRNSCPWSGVTFFKKL